MAWEPPSIPLQFPNIGNALMQGAHARYYSQEADLKAGEEQRRQAAQPYVESAMKGDTAAMGKLAAGDPKTAVAITTALSRMDTNQRAQLKAAAEYTAHASNAILQTDPKDQPAVYAQMYALGKQQGFSMAGMPETFSPSVIPMLRTHRMMSTEILKLDEGQKNRDVRLQIHNNPTSVGGGTLSPIGGGPAPMPQAPPAAMPAGRPSASAVPPDVVRNTTLAGMPGEGVVQGDSPPPQADASGNPLPQPPQLRRAASIVYDDPSPHGYVPAQNSKMPGVQHMDDKGFLYFVNPKTNDRVRWKPGDKAPEPEGTFAGNDVKAQAYSLVLRGVQDPTFRQTPAYAAAYGILTQESVTVDPNDPTKVTRTRGDISSWAPPPAFSAQPGVPPALPGGKTVETTSGKGKPLDNAARDDLTKAAGPVLEMRELVKSFDNSFGGYMVDQFGDVANLAKRNLPEVLGGADPKGQGQWWQRYQAMSNLERNRLFGSALTPGEQAEWKKATVTPGMKPEQIRANIERQSAIAQGALSRIANSMAVSGYNREAIETATGVRLNELPNPIGSVPQGAPPQPAPTGGKRPPLSSFQR